MLTGFARAINLTSSLAAKLWAIRNGLTRCYTLSLEAVQVEVDASAVISLLSQATHANGEFSLLIDDCKNLMESIPQVYLLHCFREANRCADSLAKFGTSMEGAFAIFESPPFIAKLLHSDKLDLTQDHVCNMVVITT